MVTNLGSCGITKREKHGAEAKNRPQNLVGRWKLGTLKERKEASQTKTGKG